MIDDGSNLVSGGGMWDTAGRRGIFARAVVLAGLSVAVGVTTLAATSAPAMAQRAPSQVAEVDVASEEALAAAPQVAAAIPLPDDLYACFRASLATAFVGVFAAKLYGLALAATLYAYLHGGAAGLALFLSTPAVSKLITSLGSTKRVVEAAVLKALSDCSTTTPAAPTDLAVAEIECPATFVLVFTDNATNENGFRVRDGITGFTRDFPTANRAGTGVTFLEVSDPLLAGPLHTFDVSAFNSDVSGEFVSSPSNVASATSDCPDVPASPAAPTDLTVDFDCFDNAFLVDFEDNSNNETGFRLRDSVTGFVQDLDPSSDRFVGVDIPNSGTLTSSRAHVFTVTALNAAGESEPSNTWFVYVPACAA